MVLVSRLENFPLMVMTDKRTEFYFIEYECSSKGDKGKETSFVSPNFHFCVSLRKIKQIWAMNVLVLALTQYFRNKVYFGTVYERTQVIWGRAKQHLSS